MKQSIENIGKTPILEVKNLEKNTNFFAKIESENPLSSVKDRAVWGMISDAQKNGQLKKGDCIVEATSGNTGIAVAWISRVFGYKAILTMPESMSIERRKILKFLGAELVLTEAKLGMKGAIEKAKEISVEKNMFLLNQFENMGNVKIHKKTTGPEIWGEMNKNIDFAVFCVGTGGTLSGVGSYLKSQNKNIKIIAVEPESSPVLSGGNAGSHKIQGIGAGFIPKILDTSLIDGVEKIKDEDAFMMSRKLANEKGIFVGISSGAAAKASINISQKNPKKRVVTVFPDTAERYISTALFS